MKFVHMGSKIKIQNCVLPLEKSHLLTNQEWKCNGILPDTVM